MKTMFVALGFVVVLVLAVVFYAWIRPNRASGAPGLEVEVASLVADGEHNSNTDRIAWRDGFLLVHAASHVTPQAPWADGVAARD